jgi:uncharacterized protein (TIGR03118 family)
MNVVRKKSKLLSALPLLLLVLPSLTHAQEYIRTDLVSSIPGVGKNVNNGHDAQLVNAWGLTRSAGSTWWLNDNGSGVATLFNGIGDKQGLVVTIPSAPGGDVPSTPTGIVANGTTDFALPGSTAAKFIFVTEQGVIAAWNGGNTAVIVKDNSTKGAVYKGCTIAEANGQHYLYVANFNSGEVEVYDTRFQRVDTIEDAFRRDDDDFDRDHRGEDHDKDRRNFAPFNVQAIGTNVYVSYAKQDANKHDEVDGAGLGFVEVFSSAGRLRARLQHGPWFNAPWGMALAPGEFGEFSHSLLVGNFGSGQIAAFNPVNGRFIGLMKQADKSVLTIDGLWALGFGAGNANSGPYNTMFFTAGPNQEADGDFGTIVPVASELSEIDEP